MKTVTARELKHSLSYLLDRAEKGESIEIQRQGKVIAALVPKQKSGSFIGAHAGQGGSLPKDFDKPTKEPNW